MSSSAYPSYPFQGRTGNEAAQDGSYQPFRVDRTGAIVESAAHGKYYEQVRLGNVYTLFTGPTTTAIGAGHIVGASAAAAVQHAVINPAGSGVNLAILRFANAYVSGTVPAGGIYYGVVTGCTLSASVTTFSAAKNNLIGNANLGKAITVSVAASSGSALTGGAAVQTIGIADFDTTAGSLASLSPVKAIDQVDGAIVIPPGSAFVPLWSGAGTTVLTNLSTTWEEIPA